jgi:hypothetical protein
MKMKTVIEFRPGKKLDRAINEAIRFSDIKVGDHFTRNGQLYQRIPDCTINQLQYNSIGITSGKAFLFPNKEWVRPVEIGLKWGRRGRWY